MAGAIPNLFLIGAPKCGTTALAEYLRSHPRIFFSHPKEPRFWCNDLEENPRARRSTVNGQDLSGYLRLFGGATTGHRVVAEGSTLYLYSGVAVRRILDFNPAAKFIVMVRSPVDLFHSWHSYLVRQFQEEVEDPQRAWELQAERRAGRLVPQLCDVPAKLQYRDIIALGEQMRRLFEVAARESVHVIFHEALVSDPRQVYLRTLEFLELADDGRTEFPSINQAFSYRLPWLARRLLLPPAPFLEGSRRLRGRLPSALAMRFRDRALSRLRVAARKPPLPAALRESIGAALESDVLLLGEILGRDLGHWLAHDAPPHSESRGVRSNSAV